MVDYLTEIPLPGRILVSPRTKLASHDSSGALPSFVAGPENRLVADTFRRLLDAAPRVSTDNETNGAMRGFAPWVLVLFGQSGVGKTHLARGLVRHWQRAFGDDAAQYTTAADFRRFLVDAIDTNSVDEFRRQCRTRQLLAIDDIHRLPSDDYLLQELRYTLDAYEEAGGLIVVTSHRPCDTLANLPPDVRSRLACGLMLQLAPPGSAARTRIIRHASAALGRALSDDVANRLAEGVNGTVNDLLGALFELWSAPQTDTRNEATRTQQLLAILTARRPALQEILVVVAKYTNVPQKQLKSGSRRQSIVSARAIVVYLARELAGASYDQIGRLLGGRDQTTIMHNYKKIVRELARDVATQETVADLRRILLSR